MTAQEKYMLAANIVFVLLSTWFLSPKCKWSLWARSLFVAFVFGINVWFFFHDNNVEWLYKHRFYYSAPCLWIAWTACGSWLATERGRVYFAASKEFQRTHQRFLWGIAIVLFSFLAFFVYSILRSMRII